MKKPILIISFLLFSLSNFNNNGFAQSIDEALKMCEEFFSGTKIVYYQGGQYSSSLTEIDLCQNGNYRRIVDGSFSSGPYLSNESYVGGANRGNYSGTWEVVVYNNAIYLVLTDQGGPGYYSVDFDQAGKLYLNNKKWPYQRGGAQCH